MEVAPAPDEDRWARAHARRRRRLRLALIPTVAALAAVTAAAVSARDDPAPKVAIGVGPSPAVVAACDAVIERPDAGFALPDQFIATARVEVAGALDAADDPTLVDVGRELGALDAAPDGASRVESVFQRAVSRCRDLGAAGFRPQFVAGSLGPGPAVALESYGTVVPWAPLGADVPDALVDGRHAPTGRNLSPVEVLVTPSGGWSARWSTSSGSDRRTECRAFGGPATTGSQCGPAGLVPQGVTGIGPGALDGPGVATFWVAPDVAFVVLEVDGEVLVERPALSAVVFAVPDPATATTEPRIRAFDDAGTELACYRSDAGQPPYPQRPCGPPAPPERTAG